MGHIVLQAGQHGLEPGIQLQLEQQHFDKDTAFYLGVKTRVERTKLAVYSMAMVGIADNPSAKISATAFQAATAGAGHSSVSSIPAGSGTNRR